MKNVVNEIYCGKNTLTKHITLFSILGVTSLLSVYLTFQKDSFINIKSYIFYIIILCNFLWIFYSIGYEIKFIHNVLNKKPDILPEVDKAPIAVMCNKFPLVLFLINFISFIILTLIYKNTPNVNVFSIFSGFILSIFETGYAQRYKTSDIYDVFKVLKINDYLILFLYKIWLIIIACFTSALIITFLTLTAILIINLSKHISYKFIFDMLTGLPINFDTMLKTIFCMIITISGYFLFIAALIWDNKLAEIYVNRKFNQ